MKGIHRYRHRVSGPLLDRIDIHIEVPAVPYKDLSTEYSGERSGEIRKRVIDARAIQLERFKDDPAPLQKCRVYSNGQMKTRHIKKYCKLKSDVQSLLEMAMNKLALSARAYTRILKLSRTIADLEGSEAIQCRTLDRGVF